MARTGHGRASDERRGRREWASARSRSSIGTNTASAQPRPATADSLNGLASVLHAQGDLDGARPLFERALTIFEARLGPDHPDTAHSLNNVAGVLRDQGDLDRARPLLERALHIREARLGPEHPDTVRSREQLAAVVAALENRG
jgi:tetratricopeptide (TPR) repeat protein